jgi:tRNA U34 5-carboxymethylaminomethyl modifying enzyme MnmG/GidA
MSIASKYDIIVVGGGHAGIEAAHAVGATRLQRRCC